MTGPRVLVSYHTDPKYMAPIQVSDRQVTCGPFFSDLEHNGRVLTRKTPGGTYDIEAIVRSLPADQRPELLVVKTDATRSNFPRNIAALGIPAVLILGDTQHQQNPLETVLRYAGAEKYTAYVADHDRRHLHYFREAGLQNVHWAPGLNVKDWGLGFHDQRENQVAFVGQIGKHHPYRTQLLQQLQQEPGLPFAMGAAPQKKASEIYARSLISLNFSMNGDANLRVFEVLAAGGFLLTDRLRSQAGLTELFGDEVHLVTFSGYNELVEKIRFYLAHPGEIYRIARRGYEEFHRSHSPARKRQQLIDLALHGWIDPIWNGGRDRRDLVNRSQSEPHFFNRIRNYQRFQEAQLRGHHPSLLFTPGAEPALTSDLADLYRARIQTLATEHRTYFARAGVTQEVEVLEHLDALSPETSIETLVLSTAEAGDPATAALIRRLQPAELFLEDLALVPVEERGPALAAVSAFGYAPDPHFEGAFLAAVAA